MRDGWQWHPFLLPTPDLFRALGLCRLDGLYSGAKKIKRTARPRKAAYTIPNWHQLFIQYNKPLYGGTPKKQNNRTY